MQKKAPPLLTDSLSVFFFYLTHFNIFMNNEDFRFDVALKMLCRSEVKESEYFFFKPNSPHVIFTNSFYFVLFPSNNGAEIFVKNIFKI